MKKNFEDLLVEFQQGKLSHFEQIYAATFEHLQAYVQQKTANQSLWEHIILHTMDQLLNRMYAGNFSVQEQDFLQEVYQLADLQLEKYQKLTADQGQSEDFQAQLKLRLQSKLQAKKAQDPNYFAFYWHHLRFYFMGAVFAGGVTLLAFLLGFISFHKQPEIFKKSPKLFVMTGDQAFGEIEKEGRILEVPTVDFEDQDSILSPLPKQYRITEKQIPKLPKTIRVAKLNSDFSFSFGELKNLAQLPTLQLGKWSTGEMLKFETILSGYEMKFDFRKQKVKLKNELLENLENVAQPLTSERAVIKEIKKQMKALGLSLEQYGDFEPLLLRRKEGPGWISFRLPRVIDGREVYEDPMYVEYNMIKGKIGVIQNYAFGTYELSSYPVNQSSEAIFEQLLEEGVDAKKKEDENTMTLQKWELKYVEKGYWLLKPVLIFDKGDHKVFIDIL